LQGAGGQLAGCDEIGGVREPSSRFRERDHRQMIGWLAADIVLGLFFVAIFFWNLAHRGD
jgi:hypothetical protein